MHDQAVAVGHQHPFAGAIEDGGSLAQALSIGAVLALGEKNREIRARARKTNPALNRAQA
nr:hypothetical protein GCM10020185_30360 [Pseudomonas brassicacearum subsp. brassicacearum]